MLSLWRFYRYAKAFEETLRDDDWERVRPFFRPDAVYEVIDDNFGCRLVGPDAIFAGMKKSLDGFDRLFPRRSARLTERPRLRWNHVRVSWSVKYKHDTWSPYILAGVSDVRYRGGLIAHLTDTLDATAKDSLATWTAANDVELRPAYV